jgi:FtsZ-binding cell division protein ZapB
MNDKAQACGPDSDWGEDEQDIPIADDLKNSADAMRGTSHGAVMNEALSELRHLQAEVERLTAENSSLREQNTMVDKACAQLEAENEELRKDSRRLEWLQFHGAKVCWWSDGEVCDVLWTDRTGEQYSSPLCYAWKEAIDKSMKGTP